MGHLDHTIQANPDLHTHLVAASQQKIHIKTHPTGFKIYPIRDSRAVRQRAQKKEMASHIGHNVSKTRSLSEVLMTST